MTDLKQIYDFSVNGFLVTFIDCCRHLALEEINGIFKKILDFVNDNYTVLRDTNDADSLFGGLKRFLDSAMEHITIFIARVDVKFVQNELLEKIKLLSD